jgi:hypothetical protein
MYYVMYNSLILLPNSSKISFHLPPPVTSSLYITSSLCTSTLCPLARRGGLLEAHLNAMHFCRPGLRSGSFHVRGKLCYPLGGLPRASGPVQWDCLVMAEWRCKKITFSFSPPSPMVPTSHILPLVSFHFPCLSH